MANATQTTLGQIAKSFTESGHVKELFDPVQTHALVGVSPDSVNELKLVLRQQLKATYFRIVSNKVGTKIVCFKLPK